MSGAAPLDVLLAQAEDLRVRFVADPANAAIRERLAATMQRIGVALWERRRPSDAAEAFRRAYALDPARIDALDDANAMLLAQERYDEAAAALAERLARHGDSADARVNLGVARRGLGDYRAAREELEKALALAPGHRHATWNLAWIDLEEGSLRSGFARYREAWPGDTSARAVRAFPMAHAQTPDGLAGRTLLVHADEGLGDTLLHVRFVPALVARGIKVVLEVQPVVARLARSLDAKVEVIETGAAAVADAHVALHELPWLLGVDVDHLEPTSGYLHAEPDAVARWHERLAPRTGEKLVGLAWSGNAVQPNDPIRSMPFEALAPLLALPGCRFVSLQKDVRASDAAAVAAARNVVQAGVEFRDFADTAACIAALDLVITVDSSPANLAGALGVPTWVMLSARPDWRYVRGRDDSPWFRSFRLFRPQPGESASSASSVPRVLRALRELLG